MAYRVYVNKTLMPIAPGQISLKINNRNDTVDLINGKEVNVLKSPGLSDVSFDVRLTAEELPYGDYPDGYKSIQTYLKVFEDLKVGKAHFPLVITRMKKVGTYVPTGINPRVSVDLKSTQAKGTGSVKQTTKQDIYQAMHGTSLVVSLEEYEITDDAEEGLDTIVSLSFKQWEPYGTQQAKVKLPATYTTKKGDTLIKIAKMYYGSSKYWTKIYTANKKKVKKKSKKSLKAGLKLKIPA